jgi:hypothetical protein
MFCRQHQLQLLREDTTKSARSGCLMAHCILFEWKVCNGLKDDCKSSGVKVPPQELGGILRVYDNSL